MRKGYPLSMVLFSTALDAAKNKKKRMKDVTFGRKIKLKNYIYSRIIACIENPKKCKSKL